ncbi:hypothetical protein J6590_009870 [Homalodisca vitripennis]|nr:hypothetical protein J6590_009870 [Homalodisca vitripennis]
MVETECRERNENSARFHASIDSIVITQGPGDVTSGRNGMGPGDVTSGSNGQRDMQSDDKRREQKDRIEEIGDLQSLEKSWPPGTEIYTDTTGAAQETVHTLVSVQCISSVLAYKRTFFWPEQVFDLQHKI